MFQTMTLHDVFYYLFRGCVRLKASYIDNLFFQSRSRDLRRIIGQIDRVPIYSSSVDFSDQGAIPYLYLLLKKANPGTIQKREAGNSTSKAGIISTASTAQGASQTPLFSC